MRGTQVTVIADSDTRITVHDVAERNQSTLGDIGIGIGQTDIFLTITAAEALLQQLVAHIPSVIAVVTASRDDDAPVGEVPADSYLAGGA